MRPLLARVGERLRGDGGFTLTELLMAIVIGLVVVGTATMIFTTALRSQPGQSARSESIREGRTMTERLVRELRQGEAVSGDTSNHTALSYETQVAGSSTCTGGPSDTAAAKPCLVTYSCSAGKCTRRETNPYSGTQGPALPVVSGLATNDVFWSQTDPTADCPVPSAANEGVSITDGATLRNSGDSPSRICVALVFAS